MKAKARTAIVTGGGGGLGRAIALRLARDGAAVAVWGRTQGPIEDTAAMIAEAGGVGLACIGDASLPVPRDQRSGG